MLFGATGDLARRKLLGLYHLSSAGVHSGLPASSACHWTILVRTSSARRREALDEFSSRKLKDADWEAFAGSLDYVPLTAGPQALKAAVIGPRPLSVANAGACITSACRPAQPCLPCACLARRNWWSARAL